LTTAQTLLNFKVKVKGQGRFVFSGPKFTKFSSSAVEKIVVADAIFRFSIA